MADEISEFPATPADLTNVDVNAPLSGAIAERWSLDYHTNFSKAKALAEQTGDEAAARVFASLVKICACAPNFGFSREPYRPIWSRGNQRSFIPDDLKAPDVTFLEALVDVVTHPWLRARIIDFLFLKRRRRELWVDGVNAYVAAALLCYPAAPREGLNCFTRALYLGRTLGKGSEALRLATDATLGFVRTNLKQLDPRSAVDLLRLVQTTRIGEPVVFAGIAGELAQDLSAAKKFDQARNAWSLCAKWWQQSEGFDQYEAALLNGAKLYESEGDEHVSSGARGDWAAIDCFLRGTYALQQARASEEDIQRVRTKLRQRQRAQQEETRRAAKKRVRDETSPVGWDLDKVAEEARRKMVGLTWPHALLQLVLGFEVVEPSAIRAKVLEFAELAPLSALMPKDYMNEGRVAYRQNRLLLTAGDEFEEAMREAMFEHARLFEWDLRAITIIEPCRQQIWEEHQPGIQDIGALVAANPLIPSAHSYSIVCGLHAGLSGDWLISSHLLAPKIEPLLRSILDRKNIDSTNLQSDLTQPNKLLRGLLDLAEKDGVLPGGYVFELRGILNEKTGYDFRNRIAHGFASDDECYISCAAPNLWWLFFNLCVNPSVLGDAA
jgi:hypothetical protein